MKKCSFCAEEIQDAAIKCKHCGKDLPNSMLKNATARVGKNNNQLVLVGFISVIVIFLTFGYLLKNKKPESNNNIPSASQLNIQESPEQPSLTKEQAQNELNEIMDLGKQSGLIHSYEFSNRATVVYADYGWYSQTVAFKKDFLAKVATLKKAITGYNHFEVRDAYSDEKVAEVTSFMGSLEVYK